MWRDSSQSWTFAAASNLFMITISNALTSALAHLLTEEPGHRISMPASCAKTVEDIEEWCEKNGLQFKIEKEKLILWREK